PRPVALATAEGEGGPGRTSTRATCAAIAPDGRSLVAGETSGAVRTWDLSAAGRGTSIAPDRGQVVQLSAAADGQRGWMLLQVARDGLARVWDLRAKGDPTSLRAI